MVKIMGKEHGIEGEMGKEIDAILKELFGKDVAEVHVFGSFEEMIDFINEDEKKEPKKFDIKYDLKFEKLENLGKLELSKVIDKIFDDLFKEEEQVCPAIQLLSLYEEREVLINERNKRESFLKGNDDRTYYNILCNQIIRLTEQIRKFN